MQAFPDVDSFRNASTAHVALVALGGIIRIEDARGPFVGANYHAQLPFLSISGLATDIFTPTDTMPPGQKIAAEAVGWLLSHDLIALAYTNMGQASVVVTRLGREVAEGSSEIGGAAVAVRAVDLVPPQLRSRVLPLMLSGDYDLAITAAFKAVEVRMRERAQLSTSDFGDRLVKGFFKRVTSTAMQRADRKGALSDEENAFLGLFGMYRDRAVHEAPHVDSVEYALEVIIAAAHLLRIVEAAVIETPS